MALSADGEKLLAVSDTGNWFRANLTYKNGRLAGLTDPEIAPLLDKSGKPFNGKSWNDAEALSPWQPGKIDGKVIVGFETRTRAGIYDLGKYGLKARMEPLPIPRDIPKARINSELEAIGRFASGPLKTRFIAVSEQNLRCERQYPRLDFRRQESLRLLDQAQCRLCHHRYCHPRCLDRHRRAQLRHHRAARRRHSPVSDRCDRSRTRPSRPAFSLKAARLST